MVGVLGAMGWGILIYLEQEESMQELNKRKRVFILLINPLLT
jgi:hypothetical protein